VVNALSTRTEVEFTRDGALWTIAFERGPRAAALEKVKKARGSGTLVRFWPDPDVFETTSMDHELIAQRLRETALLNPGLEITLVDERDGRSATFRFKDGLADFVAELLGGRPRPPGTATPSRPCPGAARC